MKVSLVGPVYPYRGGIALHTSLLAKTLTEEGHAVQIISFRRQYPGWLYPGASDKDPSLNPLRLPADYLLDPLFPWTWQQAGHRVTEFHPDGVIIPWWTTFWAPAFAWLSRSLRRPGIPVIYLVHNLLPHEPRPWDAALARLALAPATAFLVQSDREQKRLMELLPEARHALCPHPVYPAYARAAADRAQARRQLDLPQDTPLLLFFGIIRPYKGLSVLLSALGALRQAGAAPWLVIAGEFWEERAGYEQQIHRLGLENQVRIYPGYVPDEQAALLFAAADLFVAPHLQATQSGAAELALGAGIPLIVTQPVAEGISPALRSRLQIVPSGDAAALAQAIQAHFLRPGWEVAARQPAPSDWNSYAQTLIQLLDAVNSPGEDR